MVATANRPRQGLTSTHEKSCCASGWWAAPFRLQLSPVNDPGFLRLRHAPIAEQTPASAARMTAEGSGADRNRSLHGSTPRTRECANGRFEILPPAERSSDNGQLWRESYRDSRLAVEANRSCCFLTKKGTGSKPVAFSATTRVCGSVPVPFFPRPPSAGAANGTGTERQPLEERVASAGLGASPLFRGAQLARASGRGERGANPQAGKKPSALFSGER